MKNQNNSEKGSYITPQITTILLDAEMSLQLQSQEPPIGPNEGASLSPTYLNNDPFKSSIS